MPAFSTPQAFQGQIECIYASRAALPGRTLLRLNYALQNRYVHNVTAQQVHTFAAFGFFAWPLSKNACVARNRRVCIFVSALAAGCCAAPHSCSTAQARALSVAAVPLPVVPPSGAASDSTAEASKKADRSDVTYSWMPSELRP